MPNNILKSHATKIMEREVALQLHLDKRYFTKEKQSPLLGFHH